MKTEKRKPRRSRLRKVIITLLGTPEYESQPKLKDKLRKSYTNLPMHKVDSAIDALLLELEEDGVIELKPGNRVVLTEAGKSQQKRSVVDAGFKQGKKARQVELELKRLEIEKKKKASKEVHEKLKQQLGQLAILLGKAWEQEYQLIKSGPVVLDLVWYKKPSQLKISHAFEVQHRGDWKNAIGNLEAVNRRYPDCKLFILVFNEKQIRGIQHLLGGRMSTLIKVIKVSQLRKWVDVLEQVPYKTRSQIVFTVDDMRNSGLI
jgi:hypothetical protein